MTATKNATKITNLMYRVLKAVAKQPLTRKLIAEAEFKGGSINLGVAIRPLAEMKLVKLSEIDVDGKKEELVNCTAAGKKIAAKSPPITARGNHESHVALPKAGGFIVKTYLGKECKVKVTAEGFEYKGKKFTSLTAAAQAVRGSDQAVNGWKFFGLVKPTTNGEAAK